MARLSSFTVNAKAIEDGEWIQPGEEYDDLAVKVRGFTDQYYDAVNRRMRKAAIPFASDTARIPNAIARTIRVDCLAEFVFQDVRNLVDDAGEPVSAAAFLNLMRNPAHNDLVVAVMRAAAMVGRGMTADLEEARGN